MEQPTLRTFSAYVEDRPGVLNRVASFFRRRAFNIESLTVGRTHQPGVSRMTIVMIADDATAVRLQANLYKLIEVFSVQDISLAASVIRNLTLIKVTATPETHPRVLQVCEALHAQVVDISTDTMIVESTGNQEKLAGLSRALEPFGIIEMVSTGAVAMECGVPALVIGNVTTRASATHLALPGVVTAKQLPEASA